MPTPLPSPVAQSAESTSSTSDLKRLAAEAETRIDELIARFRQLELQERVERDRRWLEFQRLVAEHYSHPKDHPELHGLNDAIAEEVLEMSEGGSR